MNDKRRLSLSRQNKIIGGVCGGIAEFANADASLVRIITVIVSLVSIKVPLMIVIYIVCWAIIPRCDIESDD